MTPDARARLLALVEQQAEDAGLWFQAETAPEAHLQRELRRLHAAIELAALLPPQLETLDDSRVVMQPRQVLVDGPTVVPTKATPRNPDEDPTRMANSVNSESPLTATVLRDPPWLQNAPKHLAWRIAERIQSWDRSLDADEPFIRVADIPRLSTDEAKWSRLYNLIANLAHPQDDHCENPLEDEAHDLLRELREAPVGPEAPPGWQPIETAPTDTAVLVYTANGPIIVGHFNTALAQWVIGWDHRKINYPTHRMPLPAAPLPSPASPPKEGHE